MRFAASTALVLLAASLTVPAMATDPKPEEPPKEEQAKEPKKICKRVQSMGSRRTERVCMTREEWRDYNRGN